jgi:uncharacterized protein with HEPN domain
MPKRDDRLLIQDIDDCGRKILLYVAGYSFEDFINDQRTVDAVIRNFEIIGEASRNLSAESIQNHTSIPWKELIAYRNLLIHEYFGVSLKVVWSIIQDDLPELMKNIQSLKDNQ